MHIWFYLSFPLIYADIKKNTFQKLRLGGGLDGLPNEGIQMQIGRSPSHSACVACDLPRWVEWQKLRQATVATIWRTRGSRPTRERFILMRLHLFPNNFHPVRIYKWWIHHLDCRLCHAHYRWVWIGPNWPIHHFFRIPCPSPWWKSVASNHRKA